MVIGPKAFPTTTVDGEKPDRGRIVPVVIRLAREFDVLVGLLKFPVVRACPFKFTSEDAPVYGTRLASLYVLLMTSGPVVGTYDVFNSFEPRSTVFVAPVYGTTAVGSNRTPLI